MFLKDELKAQIRAMGIVPSDTVMIHTSMRAIGQVESGADGVIDAFLECLTDGLLLVPTHTWGGVYRDQPVYDVRTEAPHIGALPAAAAFRKDGIRSLHPTHSMWASGRNAYDFIKNEENAASPAPSGFAWDRLADANAKILLIGVGNEKNTFLHAVEEAAQVPDRLHPEPYEVTIYDWQGNVHRHPFHCIYCSKTRDVSKQFGNFEKPLIALGAQAFGKLGNAQVRIVDAKKCKEIILRMYSRTDKDLCIEQMDIPEELYKE